MDRLTRNGLFALAGLLIIGLLWPIHYPPQGSFQGEWLAICGFLLASLIVSLGAAQKESNEESKLEALVVPSTVLLFLLLCLFVLLQLVRIPNAIETTWMVQVLVYLGAAILAATLGATLAESSGNPKSVIATFCMAWLIAAMLNLVAQIIQAAGVEARFSPFVFPLAGSVHGRPYGNIAQPNLLGSLFGIALGCLGWLHHERRIRTGIAIVVAVLLICGLATTASRMVLGFAPVFLACAVMLPGSRRQKIQRLFVVLLGTTLFLVLHVGLPTIFREVNDSARSAARLSDLSTSGRSRLWPITLELIRASPWFGVGPGQFAGKFAEANLALGGVSDGLVHHSHNLILQLAAEYGLLGLISTTALFAWLLFKEFAASGSPQVSNTPDRIFVLALLGIIGVHSMFEFPLWYAYFLLPISFLAGLVARRSYRFQLARRSWLLIVLVLFGFLGAAAWAAWDFRSTQRLMSGFLAGSPEGIEAAATELHEERISLFASHREYVRFMITPAEASVGSPRLPRIRTAVMRHAFPKALTRLAVVEALGGEKDRARDLIRLARVMYPEFGASRRQDLTEACAAFRQSSVCGLIDEAKDR